MTRSKYSCVHSFFLQPVMLVRGHGVNAFTLVTFGAQFSSGMFITFNFAKTCLFRSLEYAVA